MSFRPLPFTVYPSKAKTLLMLLICLAFVAGSVLMICDGETVGWLGAIFFGLGVAVFLMQLYPGSSFLTVSEEGIEFCSLFRRHRFRWEDISEFGTYSVRSRGMAVGKMVGFNYSTGYQQGAKTRAFSRLLAGFEGGLPDTYGFSAEELAQMLADYHRKRVPCGHGEAHRPVPRATGA
jgi:hypothetical protein